MSNGSIERENKFRQIKSSPYKLIYRGGTENKWYSFLLHQLLPPPPPRRPFPSPPRPRWPTHITGKWGQRAGKESSVHGLSHRDLLEWGHADRNLFIGGYCNLALYIILPFLYFQIFVYIFIPPSLSRFEKFSRKEFLPFMQEVVTRSSVLFEESVYGIIYNYYLL